MKNILIITTLTIGLITIINAQGITNTLGGNTSADKFIVENSDSEVGLVVTGEGNVGIGTTSTANKLYIEDSQGAGSNTPILIINNTAPSGQNMLDFQYDGTTLGRLRSVSGANFFIENKDNSDIRMMTNDEVRMTIKNDGNVGIGTTSPFLKFEVEWIPSGNNINPIAGFETTGATNSAAAIRVQNTSGNMYNFGMTHPTTNAFAIAYNANIGLASDLLRITTNGNVGIGTINPLFQLCVGGEGSGDGGFYGAVPTIYGETSESAWGSGVYGYASNSGSSNSCGGYFSTAGDQGFAVYGRATNEGEPINVGGYFEAAGGNARGVRGSALNTGDYMNYGGYFSAAGIEGRGVQGWAGGSDGHGVHGFAAGVNGKGVVGHGNVAVTSYDFDAVGPGVNYGATSSIRWKNNIVEIDNPLEKLGELRGVYFNWDEEHGGHHDVGMIAEEVGKVLPEIVVYEENGINADGMDYSKLAPLLIEVAKAQQKLIEDLTKRIEYLESY